MEQAAPFPRKLLVVLKKNTCINVDFALFPLLNQGRRSCPRDMTRGHGKLRLSGWLNWWTLGGWSWFCSCCFDLCWTKSNNLLFMLFFLLKRRHHDVSLLMNQNSLNCRRLSSTRSTRRLFRAPNSWARSTLIRGSGATGSSLWLHFKPLTRQMTSTPGSYATEMSIQNGSSRSTQFWTTIGQSHKILT